MFPTLRKVSLEGSGSIMFPFCQVQLTTVAGQERALRATCLGGKDAALNWIPVGRDGKLACAWARGAS